MAILAWKDRKIMTTLKWRKRITDVEALIFKKDKSDQDVIIQQAIDDAMKAIGIELRQFYPDIFANSRRFFPWLSSSFEEWYINQQLTWDQVDVMLDKIGTTDEDLEELLYYWTTWKLTEQQELQFAGDYRENLDVFEKVERKYQLKAELALEKAHKLLWFDFNGDETKQISEQARSRTTIRRV